MHGVSKEVSKEVSKITFKVRKIKFTLQSLKHVGNKFKIYKLRFSMKHDQSMKYVEEGDEQPEETAYSILENKILRSRKVKRK